MKKLFFSYNHVCKKEIELSSRTKIREVTFYSWCEKDLKHWMLNPLAKTGELYGYQ